MAEACRAVVEVEQSRCSAGAEDQCIFRMLGSEVRVMAQGQSARSGSERRVRCKYNSVLFYFLKNFLLLCFLTLFFRSLFYF